MFEQAQNLLKPCTDFQVRLQIFTFYTVVLNLTSHKNLLPMAKVKLENCSKLLQQNLMYKSNV